MIAVPDWLEDYFFSWRVKLGAVIFPRRTYLELQGTGVTSVVDDESNDRIIVTFGAESEPPTVVIAAFDIDWSLGNVFSKTLHAGANTFTFSNAADGQVIVVAVTGATSTLAWPASVQWPGGVVPTQTSAGTDVYTFVKVGSTVYASFVQAMG